MNRLLVPLLIGVFLSASPAALADDDPAPAPPGAPDPVPVHPAVEQPPVTPTPSPAPEEESDPIDRLMFPATRLVDSPTALTLHKSQIEFTDLMFEYGFTDWITGGVGAHVFLMKGNNMLMPGAQVKFRALKEGRYRPALAFQLQGYTVAYASSGRATGVANGRVAGGTGFPFFEDMVASGDTQFVGRVLVSKTVGIVGLHASGSVTYAPQHKSDVHLGSVAGLNVVPGFGFDVPLETWLGWASEIDYNSWNKTLVASGIFRLNAAKVVYLDFGVSYQSPHLDDRKGAGYFMPRLAWGIRTY
jgi:hypothetical protein